MRSVAGCSCGCTAPGTSSCPRPAGARPSRGARAPARRRCSWTRARSWPRCATCARWRSARSAVGRRGLFNGLLAQYHYLGYQQPVGAHLKYLVWGAGRPLACVAWASAPRHLGPRDRFIGWSADARRRNLRFLAYNTRFLILPWVAVPHLASHVLGRMAALVPADWQRLYGHPLYFLETFIDPARFRGTCYRAANWRVLGRTTGRGHHAPTMRPDPAGQRGARLSAREGLSRSLDEDDAEPTATEEGRATAGASAHRAAVRRAGRDRRAHQGGVEPGRPREAEGRDGHARVRHGGAADDADVARPPAPPPLRREDREDAHDRRPGAAPGAPGGAEPGRRGRPARPPPPARATAARGRRLHRRGHGDDRAPLAAPRRPLPRVHHGQDLSAGGARDAGADHGDGPAGRHRLRVRAVQPVRRGLHRPGARGVGDAKYDATATTMVGLLKYGCGLPFHRIETCSGRCGFRCRRPRSGSSCATPCRSSCPPGTNCCGRRRRARSSTTTTPR